MADKPMGPHAKRLLAMFIARQSIPTGGGQEDALRFLTDAAHRAQVVNEARKLYEEAMTAMKAAPDNPHGDDDEAIAADILWRIEERNKEFKRQQRRR